MRVARALLCGLALWLASAGPVDAGTEEFSTFDVVRQEEDDESLLDHLLTRPPRAWRDEWETAPQALRSSQGCLTSGQWFLDTELRMRAPMGERTRFGVDVRDVNSDRALFTYFDFSLRVPTRYGTPGFWFRPLFDKGLQDLGLFWEFGAETASAYARLTFGLEDVFNNLWEFRQARVGDSYEPYEKHPYEPAVRLHLRRERWRVELDGQVLTPSRRRLGNDPQSPRASLWGTFGRAAAELEALSIRWSVAGDNRQARSVEPVAGPIDLANQRRQWTVEAAATRGFGTRWEADLRWLYQSRDQEFNSEGGLYLPPAGLDALDRVAQVETRFQVSGDWVLRAGGMIDRMTVANWDPVGSARRPLTPAAIFTRGSRTESRAYFGVAARFGSVSLAAVEGIELDPEAYEVWWVHDKSFVQLQARF